MRSTVMAAVTAAIGLAVVAAPSFGHHGAAVFEPEKQVTVAGTVTEFQFVNPHVLVYLSVTGEDGKDVKWGGELTSPNRLARMEGAVKWHRSILKPGDRITMTGHPARNGAPAMSITKLVDGQGTVLIGE
jgi:hydrogenase maturation factor